MYNDFPTNQINLSLIEYPVLLDIFFYEVHKIFIFKRLFYNLLRIFSISTAMRFPTCTLACFSNVYFPNIDVSICNARSRTYCFVMTTWPSG